MTLVKLNDLTGLAAGFTPVNNLSVTFPPKSISALVCSGDSAGVHIARLIAGLVKPAGGRIIFDSDDVTRLSPLQRKVGMVFSEPSLYPTLTVFENIENPLKVSGKIAGAGAKVSARRELVRSVANALGISDILVLKPHELSPLDQQRAALARALARTPAVLVLDDPLACVDSADHQSFLGSLQHLQSTTGITIIYITRSSTQAMAIGSQVAVMDGGEIIQMGNPHEIYSRPTNLVVARSIGEPPMNLIAGKISDGVFRGTNTTLEVGDIGAHDAIVGVRPEALQITPINEGNIAATVYAINNRGSDIVVAAEAGTRQVAAIAPPDTSLDIGQHVGMFAPPHEWHVFHGKTGRRIARALIPMPSAPRTFHVSS